MKNLKTQNLAMGIAVVSLAITPIIGLQSETIDDPSSIMEGVVAAQSISLLPIAPTESPARVGYQMNVYVTGYSSTPEQTDDTPFITATGNHVRDGIVATNLLPFGTRIRIPEIFGDRIFVVDDRMHPRNNQHVDVWFAEYNDAKQFGLTRSYIEVLEN